MRVLFPLALMIGALSGCTAVTDDSHPDVSAPVEVDAGVQIHSLAPITVTVEHRRFPSDPRFFQDDGGNIGIPESLARQWKTNYMLFSKALLSAAEKEQLDSVSLGKILELARSPERNPGLALLPVAAHQTKLNGEWVWVVSLRWEVERLVIEPGTGLGHIRSFMQVSVLTIDTSGVYSRTGQTVD